MSFVVFKTSFLSIDVAGQSNTYRHHPSRNVPKKTYLSLEEWPRLPFTARIFSPAQPWARQDAPLTHATTIHLNNPSKLACFPSLGRAPGRSSLILPAAEFLAASVALAGGSYNVDADVSCCSCSLNDGFCESGSRCVPKECHEGHPRWF